MTTATRPRTAVQESFRISEASLEGKTLRLQIIASGFNLSKRRYYSPAALEAAVPMFVGAKMFIDHASDVEQWERPEGSIHQWAASITEAHWDAEAKAVKGTAVLVQPAFTAFIAQLDETGQLGSLGVSIRAYVYGEEVEIEGHPTLRVDEFFAVESTDFVTYAGAFGRVEARESATERITSPQGGMDMATEAELLRQVSEAQTAQATALTRATEAEARATVAEAAREAAVTAQRESEARAIAAEEALRVAQAEATTRDVQARIAEAINAAETSDTVRARLRTALESETDFDRAAAWIASVIESVREAGGTGGQVRGNGGTTPPPAPGDGPSLAELEAQRIARYERAGYSTEAARLAVNGRN